VGDGEMESVKVGEGETEEECEVDLVTVGECDTLGEPVEAAEVVPGKLAVTARVEERDVVGD